MRTVNASQPIARVAFFCVLLGIVTAGVTASQNRPVQSDQETLIQLVRDRNAAFLRNDVAFLENILAAEFITTESDGLRGDRARELAFAARFDKQIDSATLDNFTVKIYRDTAVVWYSLHLKGPSQGAQVQVTHQYTDVFVWRDGRWQCVASQYAKLTHP